MIYRGHIVKECEGVWVIYSPEDKFVGSEKSENDAYKAIDAIWKRVHDVTRTQADD